MQQWRSLPHAGGYFDQPLVVMSRVEAALNTFDAFAARRRAKSAVEFAEQYPEWAKFCYQVDGWRAED